MEPIELLMGAAKLLAEAIELIDKAAAPAHIAARIDHAYSELQTEIANRCGAGESAY